MYLLTIRDGLQTRHFGPYESPARAAADLDALLGSNRDQARWWIHELEPPSSTGLHAAIEQRGEPAPAIAA